MQQTNRQGANRGVNGRAVAVAAAHQHALPLVAGRCRAVRPVYGQLEASGSMRATREDRLGRWMGLVCVWRRVDSFRRKADRSGGKIQHRVREGGLNYFGL